MVSILRRRLPLKYEGVYVTVESNWIYWRRLRNIGGDVMFREVYEENSPTVVCKMDKEEYLDKVRKGKCINLRGYTKRCAYY